VMTRAQVAIEGKQARTYNNRICRDDQVHVLAFACQSLVHFAPRQLGAREEKRRGDVVPSVALPRAVAVT
jgi:hypothetical protein